MIAVLSPDQVQWLMTGAAVLLALVIGANAVAGLLINLRNLKAGVPKTPPTPQPMIIALQEQFVTRDDHDELRALVDGHDKQLHELERHFDKKLDEKFTQLNNERRTSIAGLHGKLDQLLKEDHGRHQTLLSAVAELKGRVDSLPHKRS